MKFFPDLYIEENEKIDGLIVFAKLRGIEVVLKDGVGGRMYLKFKNEVCFLTVYYDEEHFIILDGDDNGHNCKNYRKNFDSVGLVIDYVRGRLMEMVG